MLADPSSNKDRVLIIEDEADLSRALAYSLEAHGYLVAVADTGSKGMRLAFDFSSDLVLLDLMLPDMPGFDVCRQIRLRGGVRQPVIVILTARTSEADRVTGFELGADDYVVKPFSVRELILRLEVRLKTRRVSARPVQSSSQPLATWSAGPSQPIVVGALEIDPASHRLFISGHEIRMSAQEMRLLLYLADPPGRMRTRRELLTDVWGYSPEVSSRTLDTHIKRIRDKLGEAGTLLQTQRGIGYRLADTRLRTDCQIISDEVHATSRIT